MLFRIYVVDLADHNAGIHKGDWVTLDGSETEREILDSLVEKGRLGVNPLSNGEYNKYAIHDDEGFEDLTPSSITEAIAIARACDDLSNDNLWPVYCEWCEENGDNVAESVDKFWEAFRGIYADATDYIREITKGYGNIWECLVRDMEINGDILIVDVSHETYKAHHSNSKRSRCPVAIFNNHI